MKQKEIDKLLTKNFLRQNYISKNNSLRQIERKTNCSLTAIVNRLKKYSIRIKTRSEIMMGNKNYDFKKLGSPNKGHKATIETLKKLSKATSGKNNPFYGKHHTIKSIAKMRKNQILTYLKNPFKRNKQNKTEIKLEKLLGQLFVNQYKYIGDSKFWIEHFNPDFIDIKNKKIIELFGDYWHNLLSYKKRDILRLKTYKKHGYKTLIVWEHELKDVNKLTNNLQEFHYV